MWELVVDNNNDEKYTVGLDTIDKSMTDVVAAAVDSNTLVHCCNKTGELDEALSNMTLPAQNVDIDMHLDVKIDGLLDRDKADNP